MKRDTRQRKHAMAGLRAIAGEERMLGTMVRVINSGKQALDAVMLEMGRMVAESVMLMEREETAGPDYHPTDPALQKWAHEDGSIFLGDQKVKVTRPRLRHVTLGELTLQSYARMRAPGAFSEELLEKILRGVSVQQYADTVLHAAGAFGVSPSAVSRKLVELTATKLKEFQQRSLADCAPFAVFLDTIHRGGEAFLVALGVDLSGEKMALGFWQGSLENHEICEALFRDLERRGLALSKRILFVTDGGSGLLKALRARFGKKLVHQRCAIHKSRNLQRHLPKQDRKAAHHQLKTQPPDFQGLRPGRTRHRLYQALQDPFRPISTNTLRTAHHPDRCLLQQGFNGMKLCRWPNDLQSILSRLRVSRRRAR